MTLTALSWEDQLLQRAHMQGDPAWPSDIRSGRPEVVQRAYHICAAITRQHSQTFYLASALLGAEARQAVRVLYAFCRVSDDLIDHGGPDRVQRFDAWRRSALTETPPAENPVALAWFAVRARYRIPRRFAEQLLDGVLSDVTVKRYEHFDDLAHYCYQVASTVGLMAMHITGFTGEAAIPYAIKLGVALQLTNILRDVGEDWANGRVYLPQTELAAFALSDADIAAGRVDDRWRDFMSFQLDRVRRLYREALPGVALLEPEGRFAIAAAAELYRDILDDVERNDYNVFDHRAYVSRQGKLKRLPGIWWRSRVRGYLNHEVAPASRANRQAVHVA